MTDPFSSDGAKVPPKPFTVTEGRRQIRSFVLRQGRFTEAQQRAFDELWPRYGLDYTGAPRDFDAVFGRSAPRVLEIGFGMGDSLLQMAAQEPDKNFIGIEVHPPGVGRLINSAGKDGIANLRVYMADAMDVLEDCIPDNSIDRLQLYFPDPWHKKKHHKRRILQPAFVQKLRGKIRPGGVFHLATDWQNYAASPRLAFSRAQLIEAVWGADWFGNDHLIDVHISNLRRKVETDPDNPALIKTVRGVGYRLDAPSG
jgi:tRNA (guanine-N7-)-methyltransferase